MSIDLKINEAQKDDVNISKSVKWGLSQSITLQYLLSAYHCLPLSNMENNMVINEKEEKISISSWIYVESLI